MSRQILRIGDPLLRSAHVGIDRGEISAVADVTCELGELAERSLEDVVGGAGVLG